MDPSSDSGPSTSSVQDASNEFIQYLLKLCPVVLETEEATLNGVLTSPDNLGKLKRFCTEGKTPVFVIQKVTESSNEDGERNANPALGRVDKIIVDLEVQFLGDKVTTLIFAKKNSDSALNEAGQSSRSIASQLQLINIGEGTPSEIMHNYMHNAFAPFFRDYVTRTGSKRQAKASSSTGNTADKQGGLGVVNQKFAELELSLYNCQQDVQIQEVSLAIHPDVKTASKKSKELGKTLKPEDLGEKASSPQFLNGLQAGVNVWGKDIQRVTKLKRIESMPPNGDKLQVCFHFI
eukprot:TRINITY_DN13980_c0_g1_i1.p1 TRINITY_DN13980_c0_g1~~TRINITY_DN13980_c0_g1_i1.p1  ORF type:complete len:292 (-),score=54.81 TRINITY_DN13980_c0_g1_i1:33-908(-)